MATDWRMIRLEKDGPLAIVTLTNPPLNVLHPHMVAELDACFTGLATDADVVVAIVTGEGERAFCAGFDIKEFPSLMAPGAAARLTRLLHASLGIEDPVGLGVADEELHDTGNHEQRQRQGEQQRHQ